MSHRARSILTVAFCAILSAALLAQPQLAARGFQEGMALCLHSVLPALFPFFVICELLAGISMPGRPVRFLARILGLESSRSAAVLLLAWVGGYAACAQLTGKLRRNGSISARDAALVMLLGCCSGPGFVIGCVGGLLLGNVRLGILLYTLQLAANLLCTAICLPLLPPKASPKSGPEADAAGFTSLTAALSAAVTSSLQVCGCVLFFRIVAVLASTVLPRHPLAGPLTSAFCEISAGCADFSALGGSAALYGCCLCLSLLGLSVWMQLALLLQGTVDLRPLLCSRLLHLLLFPPLVALCARFLPGSCAVYRTLADRVITIGRLPPDAVLMVFLFLCTALYKIRQNFYNE